MAATKTRRVKLTKPARTRSSSRTGLLLVMHPRQLAELERRARDSSMGLGPYLSAVLFSLEWDRTCQHGVPIDSRPACVRCELAPQLGGEH